MPARTKEELMNDIAAVSGSERIPSVDDELPKADKVEKKSWLL